MSGKARKSPRSRGHGRRKELDPAVAAAHVAANATVTGAKLQAAATRGAARLGAATALLAATIGVVGLIVTQTDESRTKTPKPYNTPEPMASPPQDYLLRDADTAAALSDVELFIEATYAMDCTVGDHADRAKCLDTKAARLREAHETRQRILAAGN